jgi:hypothetical protein
MEDGKSLIQIRVDKIKEIQDNLKINPFPYKFDVTDYSKDIIDDRKPYQPRKNPQRAGRIMAIKVMERPALHHPGQKGKIHCTYRKKHRERTTAFQDTGHRRASSA